jgi:hypothetical protein
MLVRVLTNKYHLPAPVVHAVSHDRYDPGDGDVSCTTLISPAQAYQLFQNTEGTFEEDASDRIWSMIGSAVHYILENACIDMKKKGMWSDENISERRFYHTVGGKKVSAQIDLFEDGKLSDFKVTSVWAIKDSLYAGKDEWTAQLNIQRYLMHHNGIEVKEMFICAIARDWNRFGYLKDSKYPPRAVMVSIKMWPIEQTETYIIGRINALFSPLPVLCTPKECWESPAKHAVMKKGAARALRLLDTHADAIVWAVGKELTDETPTDSEGNNTEITMKKTHQIEFRPGERKRCAGYCDVAEYCDQYKDWAAQNEARAKK